MSVAYAAHGFLRTLTGHFNTSQKILHSGRGRQHEFRHGGRVIRWPNSTAREKLPEEELRHCSRRQKRAHQPEDKREQHRVASQARHFQQAITTWELEHLSLAGAVQAVRMIHRATQGEVLDVDRAQFRQKGLDVDHGVSRI